MDKKLLIGAGALGAMALLLMKPSTEPGESPTPPPPEQDICPPSNIPPTQPLFHILFYDVKFEPYYQCSPTDLVSAKLTFIVRVVPLYPEQTSCCKLGISIYLDGHRIASKTIDMPTKTTDIVITKENALVTFGWHWLYLTGKLLSPCKGFSSKDAYVEFPKPEDWQYCTPW